MPASIVARGTWVQRRAVERDRPLPGHRSGDDARERALPVAGHARDADDLARVHAERRVHQPGAAMRIGDAHAIQHQQRGSGRARRAAALRHLAPDHQFGERRAVGAGGRTVRDLAAGAQHRDAVGDRQHLVQLVRDEDDREPVRHEAAQHHEQAFDLLRGQHRGRLVEHEDARAAIEHLEDLEPLLLADARGATRAGRAARRARCRPSARSASCARRRDRAAASRAGGCRARRSPARSGFRPARNAGAPCRCRHRARPAASRA